MFQYYNIILGLSIVTSRFLKANFENGVKNRLLRSWRRFLFGKLVLAKQLCSLRILGPWNFDGTSISVFFLYKNLSVGWDTAAGFIVFNRYKGEIRAQGLKDDLAAFASPYFDDVLVHIFIFVLSRADGNRLPRDLDIISFARGICPAWAGIIRRHGQFCYIRIHNWKTHGVALNFEKPGIHPTFVLPIHPNPVICIGATDKLNVGSFAKRV